jgi:RNA polymerase sigma-70 factor (ECF subfamily)
MQIVVNEARTARRAERRQAALVARASAAHAVTAAADEADALLLRDEAKAVVTGALSRLPAKHRDVVRCRYLLELSEQETADALGLKLGTVKSRLSRAVARLRADLDRPRLRDARAGRVAVS